MLASSPRCPAEHGSSRTRTLGTRAKDTWHCGPQSSHISVRLTQGPERAVAAGAHGGEFTSSVAQRGGLCSWGGFGQARGAHVAGLSDGHVSAPACPRARAQPSLARCTRKSALSSHEACDSARLGGGGSATLSGAHRRIGPQVDSGGGGEWRRLPGKGSSRSTRAIVVKRDR